MKEPSGTSANKKKGGSYVRDATVKVPNTNY